MGDLARKLRRSDDHAAKEKAEAEKPEHHPRSEQEQRALKTLQREAKKAGATLQNDGEGGLSSILVLHVFRRDGYKCKRCGRRKEISLHHKGGIPESDWLSEKGHKTDLNNIAVICRKCHDAIHTKARAEGVDSSQVTPKGDEGTKRDHGKPVAKPP